MYWSPDFVAKKRPSVCVVYGCPSLRLLSVEQCSAPFIKGGNWITIRSNSDRLNFSISSILLFQLHFPSEFHKSSESRETTFYIKCRSVIHFNNNKLKFTAVKWRKNLISRFFNVSYSTAQNPRQRLDGAAQWCAIIKSLWHKILHSVYFMLKEDFWTSYINCWLVI